MNRFSWRRLNGLFVKEFSQFKRDYSTFVLVIGIPLIQVLLFGLAINTNPKSLPTALLNSDNGQFSRTLIHEFANTHYFAFDHFPQTEVEADNLIKRHETLFTLNIPADFSRNIIRGKQPEVLLEVDGTDPVSVAYAVQSARDLIPNVFQYDLHGPLQSLNQTQAPINFVIHTKYNPNAITQYNIVPGLMGTVLTITFVMVASMALVRERERGTLESLLSTPITPLEVILGKSAPFFFVGYLQVILILFFATEFFKIPMHGSMLLLLFVTLPFILANLFVGILISTISRTQLEASQIGIVFFLPSLLLSGFAFPFKGMPMWAQTLGNFLPMTHYIYMVRGIMLKGVVLADIWWDLITLTLFMLIILIIALKRYRRTLD